MLHVNEDMCAELKSGVQKHIDVTSEDGENRVTVYWDAAAGEFHAQMYMRLPSGWLEHSTLHSNCLSAIAEGVRGLLPLAVVAACAHRDESGT